MIFQLCKTYNSSSTHIFTNLSNFKMHRKQKIHEIHEAVYSINVSKKTKKAEELMTNACTLPNLQISKRIEKFSLKILGLAI